MKKFLDIKLYLVLFILLTGLGYSFILPVAQTTDEITHMKQMCDSFGVEGAYQQYWDCIYTYNIVESAVNGETIDYQQLKETEHIKFDKSKIDFNPRFNVLFISYVPAFIGFLLGYLVNLPICGCMQMAELFNLVFATIICCLALKYMPIKRHMFMAIMLLPMCVHQYASINYDAELLPLSFLLIAYCLHLRYSDMKVGCKNIFLVLILTMLVTVIKIPYGILGLMLLQVPGEKIDIKLGKFDCGKCFTFMQKKWYLTGIVLTVVAVAALMLGRNQHYVSLFVASLLNPVQYIRLLFHSFKENAFLYYSSTIGNFGYLTMPLPGVIVTMICILIFIFAIERPTGEEKVTGKCKVLYIIISIILFNMVFVAMLSHTFLLHGLEYGPLSVTMDSYNKIGLILGVQGRYFIPALPLLFMCFDGIPAIPTSMQRVLEVICYIIYAIVPMLIIYNHLWR